MTSHLTRLIAAAALALAIGSTSGAQAEDIGLDGCYGVLIPVCDPNVHVPEPYTLEWTTIGVPVCAGSCITVPVPAVTLVPTGDKSAVCVTYETDALAYPRCDVDSDETE